MGVPKNTLAVQGITQVNADLLNTYVQTCDTAATLRTFIGCTNQTVFLLGIDAQNDGLGGVFYWNPSATGPDDDIDIIVPVGVTAGAWVRNEQPGQFSQGFAYLNFSQPPAANQIIGLYVFTRSIIFPPDFAGSFGDCQDLPTSPYVIGIGQTGTGMSVGTLTITTAGAFNFSTGGIAFQFQAGTAIKFVAPATPDPTANNFSWTIAA